MNENKKTFKIDGVRSFGFMTFVRTKKDGTTFYSFATTSDMVEPLPEKVAKRIEDSGQKWLDVYFVKKNREEMIKALGTIENKKTFIAPFPTRVWFTKNEKGYYGFVVEADPSTTFRYKKEAKKDAPKSDIDDLPF